MTKIIAYVYSSQMPSFNLAIETYKNPEKIAVKDNEVHWLGRGKGSKFRAHWGAVKEDFQRTENSVIIGNTSLEEWANSTATRAYRHLKIEILQSDTAFFVKEGAPLGIRLLVEKSCEEGKVLAQAVEARSPSRVDDCLTTLVFREAPIRLLNWYLQMALNNAEYKGKELAAKRFRKCLNL